LPSFTRDRRTAGGGSPHHVGLERAPGRIFVTKQASKSEHDWPMQFSLAAETSRQKSTLVRHVGHFRAVAVSFFVDQSSTARKIGSSSRRRKLPAFPNDANRSRHR
jgi:hypothetical protein